jgi:Na+/glutamate symporter
MKEYEMRLYMLVVFFSSSLLAALSSLPKHEAKYICCYVFCLLFLYMIQMLLQIFMSSVACVMNS